MLTSVNDPQQRLLATWREHWERIETDNESVQLISEQIYRSHSDVVVVLNRLR